MKTVRFLEPQGALTYELVRDALALVGHELMPSAPGCGAWTDLELLIAYDWAMRVHLRASDNLTMRRRPRPSFVLELEASERERLATWDRVLP